MNSLIAATKVNPYEKINPYDMKNPPKRTGVYQDGYTGKKKWMVAHESFGVVTVYARDLAGAIWTAGKFWGENPKKAAFHQGCRVKAL